MKHEINIAPITFEAIKNNKLQDVLVGERDFNVGDEVLFFKHDFGETLLDEPISASITHLTQRPKKKKKAQGKLMIISITLH